MKSLKYSSVFVSIKFVNGLVKLQGLPVFLQTCLRSTTCLPAGRLIEQTGPFKPKMDTSESVSEKKESIKAKILNRIIAKAVDFIIIGALIGIIPKVGYFAGLAYLLISDGLFAGRSAGKRLIGLRVVLAGTGKECTFRESVMRNFPFVAAYILMGIFWNIPFLGTMIAAVIFVVVSALEGIIMLGSDEGMRLGDEIARTQVIEESPAGLSN
jgi:hypothetical protein